MRTRVIVFLTSALVLAFGSLACGQNIEVEQPQDEDEPTTVVEEQTPPKEEQAPQQQKPQQQEPQQQEPQQQEGQNQKEAKGEVGVGVEAQ